MGVIFIVRGRKYDVFIFQKYKRSTIGIDQFLEISLSGRSV